MGTLFFILILFTAFTTILYVFNLYNNYNSQVMKQDQLMLAQKETSVSISSPSFSITTSSTAATTIGTSTTQTATQYPTEGKVFYSQGLWWVFYSDGTNIGYRTSSNGLAWSAEQTISTHAGISTLGYSFSAWQSGNIFYYILEGTGGTAQFYWRYGNFTSSGSINWAMSETTVGETNPPANYGSIITDNSGNVWAAVVTKAGGPGGHYFIEVYKFSGSSWSKVDSIDSGSTTVIQLPELVPLTSGVGLVYGSGSFSTGTVFIITTATGATWSAPVSPTGTYAMLFSWANSIGNTIYFEGLESGKAGSTSGTVVFWTFNYGASSTSGLTTIVSSSSTWETSLTIGAGNYLTVYYGTGANVYYVYSTDAGATWSTQNTISTGENTVAGITSADSSQGVAWVSGGASPFNVRFATAGPVGQLSLTFVNQSPFAVHLISLYVYSTTSNILNHYDADSSDPTVSGNFDNWVSAGLTLSETVTINLYSNQNYLITSSTDGGVIISTTFTSPTI